MCGIVGIVSKNRIEESLVRRMCATLAHRGPDDEGVLVLQPEPPASGSRSSPCAGTPAVEPSPRATQGQESPHSGASPGRVNIALGHRRLSIIDLSDAAHQPMTSADGSCHVVYNGEVYNFQELRGELEKLGYAFRSTGDTEVLLAGYQHWGHDFLRRLNGMFALAICDTRKRTIFLARDRAGKKPLYYCRLADTFLFASEIKALLQHPALSRELDLRALNHYFAFGYIPGEFCIFKQIRKLPPAHAMEYSLDTGEFRMWRYYRLQGPEPSARADVDTLVERLEALLRDAVKLRMISDVPLGAFLSGGVDSSVVVALMAAVSSRPVKTFSIGFHEAAFNELPNARIVARHFATDHSEMVVTPSATAVLPELARQYDEPFADSSLIPTYYLCRETRKHVTVALSGDGGDELFGGYSTYLGSYANFLFNRCFPNPVGKALCLPFNMLPDTFALKRSLLWLSEPPEDAFARKHSAPYFMPQHRARLFSRETLAGLGAGLLEPEESRLATLRDCPGSFMRRIMHTDTITYMTDDILVKVDRASMKVALEVRCPILDYRVMDFSFQCVPPSLKVRGLTTKYLLKRLAQKLLPKELPLHRKRGFAIPAADWFRGELGRHLEDLVRSDRSPFLRSDYCLRLLELHRTGLDHSARLFTLMMFYLWAREYLM